MPEEGPEPQEWVEHAAHHEHEHGGHGHPSSTMRSAITSAVLAVLAALGSLLSGHAANQAILLATKAADEWAYYQATSTKANLYDVGKSIVLAVNESQGTQPSARMDKALKAFDKKLEKYNKRDEIKHEAKKLDEESSHEFELHHKYAVGIAFFQVGIVLASVSIMVRAAVFYWGSLVAGAVGVVYLILGLAGG